jgi:hypothetical protein
MQGGSIAAFCSPVHELHGSLEEVHDENDELLTQAVLLRPRSTSAQAGSSGEEARAAKQGDPRWVPSVTKG